MRMESLMKEMVLTRQWSGSGFGEEEHSETWDIYNRIIFIVKSSTCHIFHRSNGLRTQSVDVGTRMGDGCRFWI